MHPSALQKQKTAGNILHISGPAAAVLLVRSVLTFISSNINVLQRNIGLWKHTNGQWT